MSILCTDANLTEILEYLSKVPLLSIDTETTGVHWSDRAFLATVSTPDKTFIFPDPSVLSRISFAGKETVFQNAKFDMRMLKHCGVSLENARLHDIGILDRILYNDRMSTRDYSLEAMGNRYGFPKDKTLDKYIKEHGLYEERPTRYTGEIEKIPQFYRVPKDILYQYAANDSEITLKIYLHLIGKADAGDLAVYTNECELLHYTFMMEWNGIRVDTYYTEQALFEEQARLSRNMDRFKEVAGVHFEDKKSLLVPIFERAGELIQLTEKGNPQLTDEVLESYKSPEAAIVRRIRHHSKRISTYFCNYLDMVDDYNGYIRPAIWQHGTKTGRISYSSPNLQNVPKDEEDDARFPVRGCFVPEKGNIFLSCDYSQQEYRLMLDYAGEHKVIKEVMAGKDLHQAIADSIGISRKHAKTLSFAILYGSGPDNIAGMLGITVTEARILRDKYLLSLPRVDQLISNVIAKNKRQGYVTNWLGRKLRNTTDYSYTAPNHLIQGGCGDIAKKAMVGIGKLLHKTCINMRLQVHDQLLFDGPEEEIRKYYPQIKEIMESVYTGRNGIVLTIDSSYSEKSFAERDMKKWII
jgi:DNA polymerase-1